MRLTTELDVNAPLSRAWPALLELVGPVEFDLGGPWSGRAHLDDADEDEHIAGFHLLARERNGAGTAAGTITARVSGNGDGTRVAVETDLRTTGTQVDPEALQRTADELLERLAAWVRVNFAQPDEAKAPSTPPPVPSLPRSVEAADPVVVGGEVAERAWLLTAGIALGIVLGGLLWRRR